MFYRPETGHGLAHNPFNALIVPRPIGWISTRSTDGVDNLAPYSFFNGTAYDPPQVMFASTGDKTDQDGTKDSLANIRETGVFCVNVVATAMTDAMNTTASSAPAGVSEFDLAGLERQACETIACSRVAAAPAALECRMIQITKIEGEANYVCFGVVTGVYLDDAYVHDGLFDVTRFKPLARLGYREYTSVEETFTLKRPSEQ